MADGEHGSGERAARGCTTNPALSDFGEFEGRPRHEQEKILQGRGQVICPTKTGHFFGVTYSNLEGTPILVEPQIVRGWIMNLALDNPRVYTVKSAGYDLERTGAGLAPLRESDLQAVPAGGTLSNKTQLKMVIDPWDYTDVRPIIIDWGQPVEILVERVAIKIFGPPNLYAVPPDNDRAAGTIPTRTGHVIDSVIGAVVWAMEAPRSITTAALTTNHVVPADAQLNIPVPTNAINVVGYQSPIGAAATSWTMFYSSLAIGVAAGAIPWTARRTAETPLPNIGNLVTDIDPNADRFFTLRWTIQLP